MLALRRFLLTFLAATLVALLAEKGPSGLFHPAVDQISPIFLFLAGLMALGSFILPLKGGSLIARGSLGLLVGTGVAILQWLFFPQFFRGPSGLVTEYYWTTRSVHINESTFVWAGNWPENVGRVVFWAGLSLLGLVATLFRWWRSAFHAFWGLLVAALGVFLFWGQGTIRWLPYVAVLTLPGLGVTLHHGIKELRQRLPNTLRPLTWAGTLAIAFLTPLLGGALLMASEQREPPDSTCELAPFIPILNAPTGLGANPKLILVHTDYAAAILYHTPHSVFAIPNHRPQPGYRFMGETLTADSPKVARQLLKMRQVDLVMICPSSGHREMLTRGEEQQVFYDQLAYGPPVPWLKQIPPQEGLPTDIQLFKIRPRETTTSSPTP